MGCVVHGCGCVLVFGVIVIKGDCFVLVRDCVLLEGGVVGTCRGV